jgi:hypothetical protein
MQTYCQVINNFWRLSPEISEIIDDLKSHIYHRMQDPRHTPLFWGGGLEGTLRPAAHGRQRGDSWAWGFSLS